VADEEHIAGSIARQHLFDLTNDARLGVDCAFPSRMLTDGCAKTDPPPPQIRQAARSLSPIDRSRASAPHFDRDVRFPGDDFGGLNRLRSSLEMICVVPESHPVFSGASTRARPTALRPMTERDSRINLHLRMGQVAYEVGHDPDDEAIEICRH